jgi:hypothetical protein
VIRQYVIVAIVSFSMLLSFGLNPQKVSAEGVKCQDEPSSFLVLPTWYKYLDLDENCEVVGPMRDDNPEKLDWQKASGRIGLAITEALLRIVGLVAVAYVIYGGFRYILSQGDPENAKSARQTIINGLIGLVISLIATGAVAFTARILTQ